MTWIQERVRIKTINASCHIQPLCLTPEFLGQLSPCGTLSHRGLSQASTGPYPLFPHAFYVDIPFYVDFSVGFSESQVVLSSAFKQPKTNLAIMLDDKAFIKDLSASAETAFKSPKTCNCTGQARQMHLFQPLRIKFTFASSYWQSIHSFIY